MSLAASNKVLRRRRQAATDVAVQRPSTGGPGGRQRMGDVLVARKLISSAVLADRLEQAANEGTPLGRVLMARGDLSRQELYEALAQTWGLEPVDLLKTPPDPQACEGLDPHQLLEERWIPLRHTPGRTATVAVCDEPTPDATEHVRSTLGVRTVTFVATTDWDIEQAVLATFSEELVTRAAFELAEQRPELSAADPVIGWQRGAGLVVAASVVVAAVIDWRFTLCALLVVFNLMFAVGVAFKLVTCTAGAWALRHARRHDGSAQGERIDDADLPRYTILVPAYNEANVVAQVVENISSLDYPLSKLQVLVLLEADDVDTVTAAKAAMPPDYVRLVVVPAGGPQTKPKACNVGMALAEGEFLVIYDAEDRPEPGQLRDAVAAFRDAGDDTVCVQARLNYFNTDTNFLTRMFTLEYSAWFDYMLPGLDQLHLPIPLGGTSNHFRVDALRELGGWDPFNVTEDADLGLRAAAQGRRIGIIESTTWEEACSEWKAWIRQRTRWIKGYMVTALVQLRNPVDAWRRLGARGMVGLIGLIAGTPALFLASPLVWAFFLYTFLGGTVPDFTLPGWLKVVTLATLFIGNGSMIAMTAFAARRRRNSGLVGYALLNPAYWVLHSIAAWRALVQLVTKPAHWEKTPHGLVHGPVTDEH
jgi:cellulose synthase/poly-beta-1,6-N-acetylglucosamine synthase-like glycosyltransferase